MRPFRIAWVVPVLALASPACSWIAVKPPRQVPLADGKLDCTTSRAAPIADTVGVALLASLAIVGVGFVAAAAEIERNMIENAVGYGLLVPSSVLAVIWAFSAEYGFRQTKRCREIPLVGRRDMPYRPGAGPASMPCRIVAGAKVCDWRFMFIDQSNSLPTLPASMPASRPATMPAR